MKNKKEMATKEAIGIKRERATNRIETAVKQLVNIFDLDPAAFDLEPFDHDPDYKHAMQLEGFAEFLAMLYNAVLAGRENNTLETVQSQAQQPESKKGK